MQAYGLASTSVSRYQPIISIYSKRQAKIGQGATAHLGERGMVRNHKLRITENKGFS